MPEDLKSYPLRVSACLYSNALQAFVMEHSTNKIFSTHYPCQLRFTKSYTRIFANKILNTRKPQFLNFTQQNFIEVKVSVFPTYTLISGLYALSNVCTPAMNTTAQMGLNEIPMFLGADKQFIKITYPILNRSVYPITVTTRSKEQDS